MQTKEELDNLFQTPGITFSEKNGIIFAEIQNKYGSASISLQGAHLATWHPVNQKRPVVWLSREAKFAPGKSIRGGIPVCWPWFGPHESDPSFPAHGFARTVNWRVMEARLDLDEATRITFGLNTGEVNLTQWPHPSRLELTFVIGSQLRLELSTFNTGSETFSVTEALHTYFEIGNIEKTAVSGLNQTQYFDKVGTPSVKKQEGSVKFASETDRVYLNSSSECVIEDEVLNRKIHIKKSGSLSTVVWTPWKDKAEAMGDLGQNEGWKEMVCVESGNALENKVSIPPGCRHTLTAVYETK